MECGSIHACIERRLTNRDIYTTPAQYIEIRKTARVEGDPYQVFYLNHQFFQDFSKVRYIISIRPGHWKGDPNVTDIRCLKYNLDGIFFKLKYDDDWEPLPRRFNKSYDGKSRLLQSLYSQTRKIKREKFNHLQQLKSFIPSDYHSFYDNLNHE